MLEEFTSAFRALIDVYIVQSVLKLKIHSIIRINFLICNLLTTSQPWQLKLTRLSQHSLFCSVSSMILGIFKVDTECLDGTHQSLKLGKVLFLSILTKWSSVLFLCKDCSWLFPNNFVWPLWSMDFNDTTFKINIKIRITSRNEITLLRTQKVIKSIFIVEWLLFVYLLFSEWGLLCSRLFWGTKIPEKFSFQPHKFLSKTLLIILSFTSGGDLSVLGLLVPTKFFKRLTFKLGQHQAMEDSDRP